MPSVEEIDVTASDRVEDIDEALMVVHEGFVEAGYLAPTPSGRRMHASYLNPGTMFFVAGIDGETVGTCALIADGPTACPGTAPSPRRTTSCGPRPAGRSTRPVPSAVRADHRRATRRIVMRLFAAMTRVALDGFPDAPVPLAVMPENRRFYTAMAGALDVAGPRRPWAPAVLLQTRRPRAGRSLRAAGDAHPARDGRAPDRAQPPVVHRPPLAASPYPSDWLEHAPRHEQGVTGALAAQIGLLAERYPDVLARVLDAASTRAAA